MINIIAIKKKTWLKLAEQQGFVLGLIEQLI